MAHTFYIILFILFFLPFSSADGAELSAFPGAEGFATKWGQVYFFSISSFAPKFY